jgi:hypothetical protein
MSGISLSVDHSVANGPQAPPPKARASAWKERVRWGQSGGDPKKDQPAVPPADFFSGKIGSPVAVRPNKGVERFLRPGADPAQISRERVPVGVVRCDGG